MAVENINSAIQKSGSTSIARKSEKEVKNTAAPKNSVNNSLAAEIHDEVTLSSEAQKSLKQANSEKATPKVESEDSTSPVTTLKRERTLTEDNELIVKVIDPNTQEVIRQIPGEDVLRLKEAIRSIIEQGQADIEI